MAKIIGGPFAGHEGELVADLGETLELEIVLFGRETNVRVRRADLELDDHRDHHDPREALRARVAEDQDALRAREEGEFWRELVGTDPRPPLVEQAAFEAHCEAVARRAEARKAELLAAFDARFAPLEAGEVRPSFEAERERWLAEACIRDELKAAWRADAAVFAAYHERSEAALERRARAGQAAYDANYVSWRAAHWSAEEHARAEAEASRELDRLRPLFEAGFERVWGFELPESLIRFWLFWRLAQPAELDLLRELELAPFGIMDMLNHPEADPIAGLDLRLHGRFYRDPPEMLTFMHGGSDGLHYGLFFDDGRRASGVVSYYNNDGGGLGRPQGTPLEAVRARLELHAALAELEPEQRFGVRLVREAIMRLETGDRPEQGEAYDRCYEAPARAAAYTEPDPSRLHTIDEAGALVEGEPAVARGHCLPNSEDAREAEASRIDCILADDPIVGRWIGEAYRRLEAGDAAEALCLGRDLHWLSGGDRSRERLACELLAAAYRALGRESLAAIVELHCRHRDLPSVDVLRRR